MTMVADLKAQLQCSWFVTAGYSVAYASGRAWLMCIQPWLIRALLKAILSEYIFVEEFVLIVHISIQKKSATLTEQKCLTPCNILLLFTKV